MEEDISIEGSTGGPYMVDKIIGIYMGKNLKKYYRVKWADSWEPEEILSESCQSLIDEFWSGTTLDRQGKEVKKTELKYGQKIVKKELLSPNNDTSSSQATTGFTSQPTLLPVEIKKDHKHKLIPSNMLSTSNTTTHASDPSLVSSPSQTVVSASNASSTHVTVKSSTLKTSSTSNFYDHTSPVTDKLKLVPITKSIQDDAPNTPIEQKSALFAVSKSVSILPASQAVSSYANPTSESGNEDVNKSQTTTSITTSITATQPLVANTFNQQLNGETATKCYSSNISSSRSTIDDDLDGQIHIDHNNVIFSSPPRSVNSDINSDNDISNDMFENDINIFENDVEILSEFTDSQSDVIDLESDDELEITASIESPQRKRKRRNHSDKMLCNSNNQIDVSKKPPRRGRPPKSHTNSNDKRSSHPVHRNVPQESSRQDTSSHYTQTFGSGPIHPRRLLATPVSSSVIHSSPSNIARSSLPRSLGRSHTSKTSNQSNQERNITTVTNSPQQQTRSSASVAHAPLNQMNQHQQTCCHPTRHPTRHINRSSSNTQPRSSTQQVSPRHPRNQYQLINGSSSQQTSIPPGGGRSSSLNSTPKKSNNTRCLNTTEISPSQSGILSDRTCTLCSHTFPNLTLARQHVKSAHGSPSASSMHTCDICQITFHSDKEFKNHRLKHQSTPSKQHNPLKYKCQTCSRFFKQQSELTQHNLVHTQELPFFCNICHKRFRQQGHLINHMGSKHCDNNEGSFICPHCHIDFVNNVEFKSHMHRHDQQLPFLCNICKERFQSKNELLSHLDDHNNGRPFTCHICKKSFKTKTYLYGHMQMHKVGIQDGNSSQDKSVTKNNLGSITPEESPKASPIAKNLALSFNENASVKSVANTITSSIKVQTD